MNSQTPLFVGWYNKELDQHPHIASIRDFERQVIPAFMCNLYPPKIWDSFFYFNGMQNESNYKICKELICKYHISFKDKNMKHPLLLYPCHTHLDPLYKEKLKKINIVYIYETLIADSPEIKLYIDKLIHT